MKPNDFMKEIVDVELAKFNDSLKIASELYLDIPLKGDQNRHTMFIYAIDSITPGNLATKPLLEMKQRNRHKRVIDDLKKVIKAGYWKTTATINIEEFDADLKDIYVEEYEDPEGEDVALKIKTIKETTYYLGNSEDIKPIGKVARKKIRPLPEKIQ